MPADGVKPLPPHLLWQQADREYVSGDVEDRRARYIELMIEAGHITTQQPREQET